MKALTRGLMATAPVPALLMAPVVAWAHPNNDTDVTVTTYSSTVQADIFNYHEYAIDCQTTVAGTTLYMTAPAKGAASTWHGGTPAGTHTVSWSCSSDGGAVSHGSGSKSITVPESSSGTGTGNNGGNTKGNGTFELCDVDFLGGFEKLGVCPK